jgi:hypothetical protein
MTEQIKEPVVDKDALERQALYDANQNAINKLQETKELFNYLMDNGSGPVSRKQRRQMRQDFIKNDKFAVELIESAIKFFEKRKAVYAELEKNNQ